MTGRARVRLGCLGAVAVLGAVAAGPAAAADWSPALRDGPRRALRAAPTAAFTPALAPLAQAGSPGLGDPFFELAGNGGYDVSHYGLALGYEPATQQLTGVAIIQAKATQNLSRFDLDLRGLTVASVRVNGAPAVFTRDGQELVITPRKVLTARSGFVVTVAYAGVPAPVIDPDGSSEGWVATPDGAFVVGEPQGSPGWFPSNDNPRDKATYDIAVTVPDGVTAMSNGTLAAKVSLRGRTTWIWREKSPMATYLATATLGQFSLTRSSVDGIPSYVAVDPSQAAASTPVLAKLPAIVKYFSGLIGPYPFDAVGAIVDDAPDVGYALESQTKPNFDRAPDEATLTHELVHQWYGNSVSLKVWPDIWLNEGFATYGEWLWAEHTGEFTAQEAFDDLYATPADDELWKLPPAVPGEAAELFSSPIYERGALALHALRVKVGDPTFFRILRRWYSQNRDGNVTTADFIALSQRESGKNLRNFFDVWLYQPVKPTTW